MGFIMAPALSPFAFGFLVARAKSVISFLASGSVLLTTLFYVSWRWTYGVGSMYGLFVVLLIAFFGRET
jgi:hypothetical protein